MKMIVVDMDGTLLDSNDSIQPKTKKLLIELQKKGIILVLASGRNINKMINFGKELMMDKYNGYYIQINGTIISDAKFTFKEVRGRLKQEEARELFDALKTIDVEIQVVKDNSIYSYIPQRRVNDKLVFRKQHNIKDNVAYRAGAHNLSVKNNDGYLNTIYINDSSIIHNESNKVCVSDTMEKTLAAYELILNDFKDKYWVGLTTTNWLEICNKNVYKGKALQYLCDKINIDIKDVVAFGDGENDREMLMSVGIGVAMGNSLDTLKKYANIVTDTNNNEGIYKGLEKILKGDYYELFK